MWATIPVLHSYFGFEYILQCNLAYVFVINMAFVRRSSAALFVAALLGSALAHPEFSPREEADTVLQERAICYYDDTFLSFMYWRVDAEPYCSKLLNIKDVTSTLGPATSRT